MEAADQFCINLREQEGSALVSGQGELLELAVKRLQPRMASDNGDIGVDGAQHGAYFFVGVIPLKRGTQRLKFGKLCVVRLYQPFLSGQGWLVHQRTQKLVDIFPGSSYLLNVCGIRAELCGIRVNLCDICVELCDICVELCDIHGENFPLSDGDHRVHGIFVALGPYSRCTVDGGGQALREGSAALGQVGALLWGGQQVRERHCGRRATNEQLGTPRRKIGSAQQGAGQGLAGETGRIDLFFLFIATRIEVFAKAQGHLCQQKQAQCLAAGGHGERFHVGVKRTEQRLCPALACGNDAIDRFEPIGQFKGLLFFVTCQFRSGVLVSPGFAQPDGGIAGVKQRGDDLLVVRSRQLCLTGQLRKAGRGASWKPSPSSRAICWRSRPRSRRTMSPCLSSPRWMRPRLSA